MSEEISNSVKPIVTHYIKANDFKTAFCSTVIGGVTINGLINVDFCTDRLPIPTRTESEIMPVPNNPALQQIKETKRESKEGLIKDVPFGILIDINTAKSIIEFLNVNIKNVEAALHLGKLPANK